MANFGIAGKTLTDKASKLKIALPYVERDM